MKTNNNSVLYLIGVLSILYPIGGIASAFEAPVFEVESGVFQMSQPTVENIAPWRDAAEVLENDKGSSDASSVDFLMQVEEPLRYPVQGPRVSSRKATVWGIPGTPSVTFVAPEGAVIKGPRGPGDRSAITGSSKFEFDTGAAGWAGGGLTYDDEKTSRIETKNFSALDKISFEIQSSLTQMKFEVVDKHDNKAVFYLEKFRSQDQTWEIDMDAVKAQGIDVTQVRTLYFIVEGRDKKGIFVVNVGKSTELLRQNDLYVKESFDETLSHKNYRVFSAAHSHCGRAYCPTIVYVVDKRTERMVQVGGEVGSSPLHFAEVTSESTPGGPVLIFQMPGRPQHLGSLRFVRLNDLTQKGQVQVEGENFPGYQIVNVEYKDAFATLYPENNQPIRLNLETFEITSFDLLRQEKIRDLSKDIAQAAKELEELVLEGVSLRAIVYRIFLRYRQIQDNFFSQLDLPADESLMESHWLYPVWKDVNRELLNVAWQFVFDRNIATLTKGFLVTSRMLLV